MRAAAAGAGGEGGPAGAAGTGLPAPGGAAGAEPAGAGPAAAGVPAQSGEAPGGPDNGGERKRQCENAEEARVALEAWPAEQPALSHRGLRGLCSPVVIISLTAFLETCLGEQTRISRFRWILM